jgi:hypothetical protein
MKKDNSGIHEWRKHLLEDLDGYPQNYLIPKIGLDFSPFLAYDRCSE